MAPHAERSRKGITRVTSRNFVFVFVYTKLVKKSSMHRLFEKFVNYSNFVVSFCGKQGAQYSLTDTLIGNYLPQVLG